jgi:hypothetical protein
MAWLTNKETGGHFNTDWIDKERQIAANKAEARERRIRDANLDSAATNEFEQGLDAVLTDFGIENDVQFDYSDTDSMIAQTQSEDGQVVIYLTSNFKDYENLYKTVKHNASNAVETSIPVMFSGIHEAGHVLEHKLNPYGEHYTKMFSEEVVKKAQRQCRADGKDATRKSISVYATKDYHETVAEAITDYYHNGDNAQPLSKAIYNELKRRVKKGN